MLKESKVTFETSITKETYTILNAHGMFKEHLAEDARRILAMRYFQDRILSLGQAADMANLNRWDFIQLLSREGIPVIDLSSEEFESELAAVDDLTKSLHKSNR